MEEQEEQAKAILQNGRRGERNKESLRLGHVVEKPSAHHTRLKDRHSDPLQRAGLFWVVASRDLMDSIQLQRARIHCLLTKAQGTGVGSLSQWW